MSQRLRSLRMFFVFVLRLILPKSLFEFFGALIGGISVFALIDHAYSVNSSSTIELVLNEYDNLVQFLSAHIEKPLTYLFSLVDVDISLDPIWGHIAIFSGIYIYRNGLRHLTEGRRATGLFELSFGTVAIIVASVSAGLVYDQNSMNGQVLVVLLPLLAIFSVNVAQGFWFAGRKVDRPFRTWPDFGGTYWHFVWQQVIYSSRLLLLNLGIAFIVLAFLTMLDLRNPSIGALVATIFFVASYWLILGFRDESVARGSPSVLAERLEFPASKMGISMLHLLVQCFFWAAASAGLPLAGL